MYWKKKKNKYKTQTKPFYLLKTFAGKSSAERLAINQLSKLKKQNNLFQHQKWQTVFCVTYFLALKKKETKH